MKRYLYEIDYSFGKGWPLTHDQSYPFMSRPEAAKVVKDLNKRLHRVDRYGWYEFSKTTLVRK